MKDYAILVVPNDTSFVCSLALYRSAKVSFAKYGYSFKIYDETTDTEETITYTDQDCRDHALNFAQHHAITYHKHTIWCVDGETLEIIAAFRVEIKQLI